MFNNKRSVTYLLVTICYLLSLPGCVTSPYIKPVIPKSIALPGIYHKVVRGETLWKISKMYNISLDELTQVNRIGDNTAIEVGQQIFIPNYFRPQALVVKYSDNDDFIWPIRGRIVGSFGQTINNMLNKGINITPYGSGDIIASRAGRVVFLNDNFAGLGKTIILDHEDGFFTVYSLSSEVFVRAGDNIKKGAVIARLGSLNLGRNKYLHFEVRKGHIPQNPMFYLP